MDKERKIQIIKAAVKRFTKHGINKTTLDEVARDLRIGKATIYHYFNSKQDLYYRTLEYEISLYLDEIRQILNDESSPRKDIIIRYFSFKKTCSAKYRLIYELLMHVLSATHIEPEIDLLKVLLTGETEAVKELTNGLNKKEEASYLPGFIVIQSWGFLFGSILESSAAGNEERPVGEEEMIRRRVMLTAELENFIK